MPPSKKLRIWKPIPGRQKLFPILPSNMGHVRLITEQPTEYPDYFFDLISPQLPDDPLGAFLDYYGLVFQTKERCPTCSEKINSMLPLVSSTCGHKRCLHCKLAEVNDDVQFVCQVCAGIEDEDWTLEESTVANLAFLSTSGFLELEDLNDFANFLEERQIELCFQY